MHRLAAAATPFTIDPALLALIPIVTVVLTIIAGLVGAWVQSRREHLRWLRERRYEAFRELITLHNQVEAWHLMQTPSSTSNEAQAQVVIDRGQDLLKRFPEAVAPLSILGPKIVSDAASEYMKALNAKDKAAKEAASKRLTELMQDALDIKD